MTPQQEPRTWKCENCGGEDLTFDRSLCACGAMHYFCGDCGSQDDPCDYSPAPQPESMPDVGALAARVEQALDWYSGTASTYYGLRREAEQALTALQALLAEPCRCDKCRDCLAADALEKCEAAVAEKDGEIHGLTAAVEYWRSKAQRLIGTEPEDMRDELTGSSLEIERLHRLLAEKDARIEAGNERFEKLTVGLADEIAKREAEIARLRKIEEAARAYVSSRREPPSTDRGPLSTLRDAFALPESQDEE